MTYYLYNQDEFANFEELSHLLLIGELRRNEFVDVMDENNGYAMISERMSIGDAVNAYYNQYGY